MMNPSRKNPTGSGRFWLALCASLLATRLFSACSLPADIHRLAAPATPSLAADKSVETSEQKIAYPNYVSTKESPDVGSDQFGIKIVFAGQKLRTQFMGKEPWLLFGAARVGRESISEFGSDINAHLLAVVSHKESGAVNSCLMRADHPGEVSAPSEPEKGGDDSAALTYYFNVDIKKQCKISETPGKYWVVILLGRLASPVLEFEVK